VFDLAPEADERCTKIAELPRGRLGPLDEIETMNVEIQTGPGGDAAAILVCRSWPIAARRALQDWSIPPLVQSPEEICTEFAGRFFVKVERGGEIIGSVRAEQSGETCAIGRVIVHPTASVRALQLPHAGHRSTFPFGTTFELFTGEKSTGNIRLYDRLRYRIFRRERFPSGSRCVHGEKVVSGFFIRDGSMPRSLLRLGCSRPR